VLRGDRRCRPVREARRHPAPTLIIAGADDPATPPERLESIRDAVPDARLEILSPAAHLANIERPEAITQAIFDHLQAVARGET
jgi:3-oxoadipate enol-lactonase